MNDQTTVFDDAANLITQAKRIVVIQAENPDGDSLGSALGLEAILGDLEKSVQMHCPVAIPKYLHYFDGWDRVTSDFDTSADLAIIVDTSTETLLSQSLAIPGVRHFLESHPVIIFDHHIESEETLSFNSVDISDRKAIAACQVVTDFANSRGWSISKDGAMSLLGGILSDSLGLSTSNVSIDSMKTVISLLESGAHPAAIEEKRRDYMKKSPRIANYKGSLLQRIEYECMGELAIVHVPWSEIEEFSDEYNPGALIIDEMRLITDVDVAVVLKTYPDGRITGKIKGNLPLAADLAGYFGGGGHGYAAGFRAYDEYDTIRNELVNAYQRIKQNYDRDLSL